MAAAGSVLFLVVAPGAIAGLIPWLLTGWNEGLPPYRFPVRALGVALIAAGVLALAWAFARFVMEGAGTPAPIAPTDQLVVGGLYRFVRNPTYVAVVVTVVGQALFLVRPILLVYAAGLSALFAAFVRWYEEPTLARRFGARYEAYRMAVPAWRPRLPPWDPEERS